MTLISTKRREDQVTSLRAHCKEREREADRETRTQAQQADRMSKVLFDEARKCIATSWTNELFVDLLTLSLT